MPWASSGGSFPQNQTKVGEEGKSLSETAEGEKHGEALTAGQEKGKALSRLPSVAEKEAQLTGHFLKVAAEAEPKVPGAVRERLGAFVRLEKHVDENTTVILQRSKLPNQSQSHGVVTVANLRRISQNQKKGAETVIPKFPLKSYQGLYRLPLFGNFSVSLNPASGDLECQMNVLTGILHPLDGHMFGVELTKSLRFLSKPSRKSPAKNLFKVFFVESDLGEITAVDIYSNWAMEVPLRFHKMR